MVVFDEETEPRLLANDPTITSLSLRSSELMGISNVSHRVGRAIASTTHLTTLELDLKVYHDDLTLLIENQEGLSETALQETAIFLSSSSTLESLFMTTVLDEEAHKSTSVAGVFMFALNDRISRGYGPLKSLSLEYFTIKTAHIVSLIQNGLQSLYMDCCMIHPGPSSSMTDAQNNREVARSIATSKTLKQLTLGVFEINVALVCALLQEKEYNCKLDFLALRNSCELDHGNTVLIGNALGQFIRNSPSPLAVLCLHNFDWTGQSFAPIAENVSTAETTLAISGGSMDGASCQEWASLYPPESAAKAFVLSLDVEFPEAEEHQPLTHMVASLPGLTDLVLRTKESAAATGIQRDSLLAITKGLVSTKCPLKKLTFANAFPDSLCEILIKALPFFCSLEYLKLHLSTDSDKGEFMKAFQRNRSLKEVSIEGGGFNASDRTRLNVYLERNRCLPMAIQSEASTLQHANASSIPIRRNTMTNATSTTNGKIVPALFQITTDSAVTAIGVSHLVGGLLCGEESLGRLDRTSGERSVSGNQGSQSTK